LRTLIKLLFLTTFLLISSCLIKAQGRFGIELPPGSIRILTSVNGNLYSGIDNYFCIDNATFFQCDTLLLSATNSFISCDTIGRYLIIPEQAGDTRLTILCIKSGDTLLLGYKFITVHNLPEPCLALNNLPISNLTSISKSSLLESDSIGIYLSDDIIGSESWFRIIDFTIGYNYGGFHVSHLNISNKLSQQTKELINRLGPDHEICIRINAESVGEIRKRLPIYRIKLY